MSLRAARWLALAFALAASCAGAETLPLPASLVDLSSPDGERMFFESGSLQAYFPLSAQFVTQQTQAYCGVASMAMVLNALHAPAPASPEYQPYRIFTQDNLLDEKTDAILPREVLARQGMTLDQLGALLAARGAVSEVHHVADGDLDAFRATARAALGSSASYVLVNYLRAALAQERGGHISPLAAYDDKADRFLILDVARYKYPPVWVKAADLFEAMNTIDPVSGKTRGYVLASRAAPAP